jgi:hypothetical protein
LFIFVACGLTHPSLSLLFLLSSLFFLIDTSLAHTNRVTATVVKEAPDQKLGISLKRNPTDGSTVIGRVNPDGLFGRSKLKEGMHVVSINNVPAKEKSLQDLLAVMTSATGPITILAMDADSVPSTAQKRGSSFKLFGGDSSSAMSPADAVSGKQYVRFVCL